MPGSVAVMSFFLVIAICCGVMAKFNPLAKTSCFEWVSFLSDISLPICWVKKCFVQCGSIFLLPPVKVFCFVLLGGDYMFLNFCVYLSLLLAC